MDVLYEESNPIYPIICFLNMGSDPTTQIEQLAKKNETLCMPMSMGQGQEVHARKLITSAMEHVKFIANTFFNVRYTSNFVAGLLGIDAKLPLGNGLHDRSLSPNEGT